MVHPWAPQAMKAFSLIVAAVAAVAAAQHRLIDPAEMGILFKALAITSPGLATPAGFADPASAPAHNQRRPNP